MRYPGEFAERQSFTLIELLVVVSIIAIISAFIFVNVRSGQIRSRDTSRVADFEVLNNAIQMYYREFGHFPSLPDGCGTRVADYGWINGTSTAEAAHWVAASARASCVTGEFIVGLRPGFIGTLPSDPGPERFGYSDNLSTRGITYARELVGGSKECYKITLWYPENRNDQRYKSVWDPARDGGVDDKIVDGTDITAWAHFSPGCSDK